MSKEYNHWEERHNPDKRERMVGITIPHRRCHQCNQHKTTPGSSQSKGKFICKECKNANKPG